MEKLTLPAYKAMVDEGSKAILHAFDQLSQGNFTDAVEINEPSEDHPLASIVHGLNNLIRHWHQHNNETASATDQALRQQLVEKSQELDEALVELNAIRSRYLHQSWTQHATVANKLHSYAIQNDQPESNTEAWLPIMTKAVEKAESVVEPAAENEAPALAVPIYLHGEIIGVVGLTSATPHGWSETDLADVETIIDQVGITLESQRLTDQTQAALNATELQAERMLQLYDMSQQFNEAVDIEAVFKVAAAHIPEIIPTDHISVAWLNEQQTHYDQYVLLDYMGDIDTKYGLIIRDTSLESIIEETMVMILPDASRSRWPDQQQQAQNGIRATLNVPLVVNGQVQGILNIGSRNPNTYSQKDEAIMLQTATLLSAAIENKRLIDRLQTSLKEAQALAEISRALSEVQSFETMLQQIVTALQRNGLASNVDQVFLTRFEVNQNNEPTWSEVLAVWQANDAPWIHPHDRYYLPDLPLTPLWIDNPNTFLTIENALTDTRLTDAVRQVWLEQKVAARLLIPLYVKGRWAGQLSLSWQKPQAFTDQDKRVYQALMSQLGPVVDNQHLFDEHQRLATIIEHHPDFIGIGNMAGQAIYLNPSGLKMVGWPPDFDVRGMDVHDFYSPADAEKVLTEGLPTALAEGSWTSEVTLQTADGRTISVEQTIGINYAADGKPASFSLTMRDITSRKIADATLAKQASELQAVARVSQATATILNTQELLQQVVDLTVTNFNHYQAQILILDEASQMLILKAGTGDIGAKMVAEGRQIALRQARSIIALAGRTKQGVIVNNVDASATFLPDPALPDVRSEMAIPLLIGKNLLGVMDIQSDVYDRFNEEDLAIHTTLAAQIAVALQNARSFEKSEQAVQELNDLTRRLTREGWDSYLAKTSQVKHHYNYNLGQDHLVQQADSNDILAKPGLSQVVQIQGEPIGQIQAAKPAIFNQEANEIMTAVAERLGVHLENLRLSEQARLALNETEQQASRLAVLNKMAAALNEAESNDMVYAILLNQINNIVGGNVARIGLFDETGQHLQMYRPDSDYAVKAADIIAVSQSRIQQALTHRKVIITADTRQQSLIESQFLVDQGILSSMIAPLTIGRIVVGTIHAGSSQINTFTAREENLMQQVASLGATTLANLRLLQDTQSRAERERRVRLITDKIRRSPDQASILKVAHQEIGRILQATDSASVLGNQAQLSSQTQPAVTEAIRTQRTIVQPLDSGQIAALPINYADAVIGALSFSQPEATAWAAEDIEDIEAIVEQLGLALENQRLFDQTQKALKETEDQAERLRHLSELGASLTQTTTMVEAFAAVGTSIAKVIDNDRASIALIKPGGDTYEVFVLGGLVGSTPTGSVGTLSGSTIEKAIQSQSIIINDDLSQLHDTQDDFEKNYQGMLSNLVAPLIVGGNIVGTLNLGRKHKHAFAIRERLLVQQLASLLASTLENQRLLDEAQKRARREQRLREVTARIRSSSDVNTIMQIAAKEVSDALGQPAFVSLNPNPTKPEQKKG